MGDWFGARCRAVDRELLKVYADRLSRRGIDYWQAHSHAENIVCESITRAKRSGRYDSGPLGIKVLASKDGELADRCDRIRKECGVRDEDIRWWWDLDEVQRIACRMEDEQHHARMLLDAIRSGMDSQAAMAECRRLMPHYDYGDGYSPCGLMQEILIPVELLKRIERGLDSGVLAPGPAPDDYSSYNEFVMDQVRAGVV